MRTPDNYDQFLRHDREQQRWLDSLPCCCYCGHKIQDEELFDNDGILYHVDCAVQAFTRRTEDYME